MWIKWGLALFSPFYLNKAKSHHHGRSPRRCHACYGIDKMWSDINTMAGIQSNYVAWHASIPASHAVPCWRPSIQWTSEIRLAVFIFKPGANLVSSPQLALSLCPKPCAELISFNADLWTRCFPRLSVQPRVKTTFPLNYLRLPR